MSCTDFKKLSEQYSSASAIWNQYAELFHEYLQECNNEAYESFVKDESQNRFSFSLFGHECSIHLISKIDGYLFEYVVSRPNRKPVVKTFEEFSHLAFMVNTSEVYLTVGKEDYNKSNFLDVMNALRDEIKSEIAEVEVL